jgi:hypothetical protein
MNYDKVQRQDKRQTLPTGRQVTDFKIRKYGEKLEQEKVEF